MANTPNVQFSVTNNLIAGVPSGEMIAFVQGKTTRGPINNPKTVIRNWPQFQKIFGGYREDTDFPHLCKRMLDRGVSLRVNRLAHYDDLTEASSLTAEKATMKLDKGIITFSGTITEGSQFIIQIGSQIYYRITTSAVLLDEVTALGSYLEGLIEGVVAYSVTESDDDVILTLTFAGNLDVEVAAVATTGTAAATIENTLTDAEFVNSNDDVLFTLVPKWEGEDFNNISVEVANATNGDVNKFNLIIRHAKEPSLNEVYTNLHIPGSPTAANSDYLAAVKNGSKFFDVVYSDLTGVSAPIWPVKEHYTFSGGTDGDPIAIIDHIGDSSTATGMQAFNEYDDGYIIGSPGMSDTALATAYFAYAQSRKDLIPVVRLVDTLLTADALVTEKNTYNLDNKYSCIVGGGLKVTNPTTGQEVNIAEDADLIGCIGYTFNNFGAWYSPFGKNRGEVPNALGVVNNFGSVSKFEDLNFLANNQINMVIQRDGQIFFQNNVTGRKTEDMEQQLNVVMFELYLKKTLRPRLENYLDEPLNIDLFRKIYYEQTPFLDQLQIKGAMVKYTWEGDQFATSPQDYTINDPNDVDNGKYKIKFGMTPTPALREISFDIILTPSGVTFN